MEETHRSKPTGEVPAPLPSVATSGTEDVVRVKGARRVRKADTGSPKRKGESKSRKVAGGPVGSAGGPMAGPSVNRPESASAKVVAAEARGSPITSETTGKAVSTDAALEAASDAVRENVCPECGAEYKSKAGVSLHRRNKHPTEYHAEVASAADAP